MEQNSAKFKRNLDFTSMGGIGGKLLNVSFAPIAEPLPTREALCHRSAGHSKRFAFHHAEVEYS